MQASRIIHVGIYIETDITNHDGGDSGEVLVENDRGEVLVRNDGGEVLVENHGGEVLVAYETTD